jgi:hypothetical protein
MQPAWTIVGQSGQHTLKSSGELGLAGFDKFRSIQHEDCAGLKQVG